VGFSTVVRRRGHEVETGTMPWMEGPRYLTQPGTDERAFVVRDVYVVFNTGDNGGRRAGIERRRFSYSDHIPERRCGVDRRCGNDRRECEESTMELPVRMEAFDRRGAFHPNSA